MNFPLDLWDISTLMATATTILFITSELVSPYYRTANLKINRGRLRNAAFLTLILFLATITVRIILIVLNV